MPPFKDLLVIAFGVCAVLTGILLIGRNHQYHELLAKYEAMVASQEALQKDAERTVNAIQKQYDDDKAANDLLVRGLRSQLAGLRKSAAAASAGSGASPAAAGSGADGGKPDVIGVLLEGAELAAEGAEALRAEHSALKACVDLHRKVNGEHSPQ